VTTTTLIRPLPLRVFLENGGDPRAVLGKFFGGFLEYCQELEAGLPRHDGFRTLCRHEVDCALRGESPGEWANGHPMDPITDQTRVTMEAWLADLYDDPSLVGSVVAWRFVASARCRGSRDQDLGGFGALAPRLRRRPSR
jgi:hypothetical protein